MKFVFGPDITLCGELGSAYPPANLFSIAIFTETIFSWVVNFFLILPYIVLAEHIYPPCLLFGVLGQGVRG